jgi:hypothetical protein
LEGGKLANPANNEIVTLCNTLINPCIYCK